jgi:segregation and condensation protein B
LTEANEKDINNDMDDGEDIAENYVDEEGFALESVSSDIAEGDTGDDNGSSDGDLFDGAEFSDAGDEGVSQLRILEALIFASDEHLTPTKLKALIPGAPDAKKLRKMAAEINAQLSEQGHPFEIVEAGGGYQFRTVSSYHPYVRKLYKERVAKKLSLQALECLAIIAYRQPISKAEVEAIRGVLSDGAMKTLLERKMVDICGRSEKPGRPLLYGTTKEFLRYFGINKITDLPRIEEFEALARAKMEELPTEELADGNRPAVGDVDDGNTTADGYDLDKDIIPNAGADGNRPVLGDGDDGDISPNNGDIPVNA